MFYPYKKKCKDYLKADVSTLIIYLQMSKCILARATSENEVYLGGWCLWVCTNWCLDLVRLNDC